MRKLTPLAAVWILVAIAPPSVALADDFPAWAYPVNPPASGAIVPDDGQPRHVPDSPLAFTRTEISAIAVQAPDWHPDEHPPMPSIVANGRAPAVLACGYCHLPNGAGRPENTSVAGLSANYIRQQMHAFKNGDRPGSEPKRLPQTNMIALARSATEAEIEAAAQYFSSLKPVSFIRVIEAADVPKTIVAGWTLTFAPDGGTEPLGRRIIEMPEEFQRFENRDSRTPYIAYVPVGSVKKGAELVASGFGDKARQCATCHGPDLHGLGDVPRLTGRSPSYLFRQLYDFKQGTRRGGAAELMKPTVAQLETDDMIAIAAYLASRAP